MGEKRKSRRRHLIYYLKVLHQESDEVLGFLVDISPCGIMVMSERPIPVGEAFRLRIQIPPAAGKKEELRFQARSIWSAPSVNANFHDTGLKLLDVDAGQLAVIQNIINDLGFSD